MNGRYLAGILSIEAKHALYREDGQWYHHLKEFPGVLFDRRGYLIFKARDEYLNNSKLRHTKDLHVEGGISSIEGYRVFSDTEIRKIIHTVGYIGEEETIRILRQVGIIVRNAHLVVSLKKLYNNTCQLCRVRLKVNRNIYYSEVHHIKPLGGSHKGPDTLDNMICVCPNCHVLLDLGAIELEQSTLMLKHTICSEYIFYHNNEILIKDKML